MHRAWVKIGYWAGIVGIVACARALYVGEIGPRRFDTTDLGVSSAGWWALFAALLIVSAHSVGLPELPMTRWGAVWRSGAALFVSLVGVSIVQLVLADVLLPRSATAIVAFVLPVWTLLVWNVSTDAGDWTNAGADLLLVTGRPEEAASFVFDVEQTPTDSRIQLLGTTSVEEARVRPDGTLPLVERAEELCPTVIVIDRAAQDEESIVSQCSDLHRTGTRIRTVALFSEEFLGKIPVSELAQVSLLFDIGEIHRARYVRVKRVFDLFFGVVGLILLGVILPVIALGNLLGNRGQLFFRQERVGKNGDLFTLLKLRTMSESGDDDASWTSRNDERITPFGRFLRRTHLDELPQVLNVFQGDLSIVGPRPEQTHYVDELSAKIPFYDARHLVRPGLTGWAQVMLGYADSEGDALEKLQYDFYYLRRQSVGFDVRIVGRTLREVVGALGR